jgi:hypothetical protein
MRSVKRVQYTVGCVFDQKALMFTLMTSPHYQIHVRICDTEFFLQNYLVC